MRIDDLALILLAMMVLLVSALVIGMSCAGKSRDYRSFPQYSPARPHEQRCPEQPDVDLSELDRRHDEVPVQGLMWRARS